MYYLKNTQAKYIVSVVVDFVIVDMIYPWVCIRFENRSDRYHISLIFMCHFSECVCNWHWSGYIWISGCYDAIHCPILPSVHSFNVSFIDRPLLTHSRLSEFVSIVPPHHPYPIQNCKQHAERKISYRLGKTY